MNIRIAREIVLGYLNRVDLDFDEKLEEISLVIEDDSRLLKHINGMIDVLSRAKEEIERGEYERI